MAGGNIGRTAADSEILYEYGLVSDWHSSFTMLFHWSDYSSAVEKGWAKAGIKCETDWDEPNKYYLNGKRIDCDEAYKHLKANFKKVHSV